MNKSVKTVLAGTFAGTSLKSREKSVKEIYASGFAFVFIGCVMLIVDAPTISPTVQVVCGSFFILLGVAWLAFMYRNRPKPLTLEQEERCNQMYAGMVREMKEDEAKEAASLAKIEALPDSLSDVPLPTLKKIKAMLEEEQRKKT